MFSALQQGSQIYILDKKNEPTLQVGEIVGVPSPTSSYNSFGANNFLDNKIDITAKVNGETIKLRQISGGLSVASDPVSGTIITETKELMAVEVDNMVQSSKRVIESIPYHEKVISAGEEMLKKLNPRYAKEQERDEDISNLKAKVGGMENKLDKILGLLDKSN